VSHHVRPLTAADATAFREIRLEALRLHPEAYGSTLAQWEAMPLSAYAERIENGILFGLFTDNTLNGILAYTRESGNAAHRAALNAAYVRETSRGNGAFKALLAAALAQAQTDGVAQIELSVSVENAPAIAAYARAGFERVAVLPRALGFAGRYVDEAVMVLRLDQ
jgi:RimJ/RimL family protein N-acetyltransferase